jgi:hypothetical protein
MITTQWVAWDVILCQLYLKMGTFVTSKKSVYTYQSTRLKIIGDLNLHQLYYEYIKSRENDYLRIPSSSRYLTMLSWQRPCYFAFYAVSCTGVIHSIQLEAKPDTFPLRVLSWLEKEARGFQL